MAFHDGRGLREFLLRFVIWYVRLTILFLKLWNLLNLSSFHLLQFILESKVFTNYLAICFFKLVDLVEDFVVILSYDLVISIKLKIDLGKFGNLVGQLKYLLVLCLLFFLKLLHKLFHQREFLSIGR